MSKAREIYDSYREIGMTHDRASLHAFLDANREGEEERIEKGLDYSETHVRVAIVHARQDLALAIYHLGNLNRAASSIRRWLIALTLIALWMLYLSL